MGAGKRESQCTILNVNTKREQQKLLNGQTTTMASNEEEDVPWTRRVNGNVFKTECTDEHILRLSPLRSDRVHPPTQELLNDLANNRYYH